MDGSGYAKIIGIGLFILFLICNNQSKKELRNFEAEERKRSDSIRQYYRDYQDSVYMDMEKRRMESDLEMMQRRYKTGGDSAG